MDNEINNGTPLKKTLKRFSVIVVVGYIAAVICFFLLAGQQLFFRQSDGNTELPPANSSTVELSSGNVVEQIIVTNIQRLETIGVQWTTFYRANSGIVTMELYNMSTGEMVMSQSYSASEITEGQVLTMSSQEPLENSYKVPYRLKIYCTDSAAGSSAAPLINTDISDKGTLSVNGEPRNGSLCFYVSGTDNIWIGQNYWAIAGVGFVLVLLFLAAVWGRFRKGKHSYIVNALVAKSRYRFLIHQLVERDFKTKYKRSVLGVLWSFLNPLLTMAVQYFVFSTIFNADIANYPTYLLIGVVVFNFFSESCNMSLTSIVGNANLITKVYVPKYIYPVTRVISSMVNFGISLIPLVVVCIFTGVTFHQSTVLALFFLMCLIIFCMGFGLFLSAAMVFFRDMQFLWSVFSMLWMYATPIFYPESILPDYLRYFLGMNPLYHFLKNIRSCVLDGLSPEPVEYLICFLFSLAALIIGAAIFRKNQDKFVLYL
jgi:ABC-2 type transport system permease protein